MTFLYIIVFIVTIYDSICQAQKIIMVKDNDFWHIIAPPGTGKTTLCGRFTRNAYMNNKKVYANVPIRGAIKFKIKDLGKIDIHDSIILIDEAGRDLNNRNWAHNLTEDAIGFIKLHRHYNNDIYLFSQSPGDIDNKFRDLVTRKYLLYKSKIPFYVYAQSLKKVMKLEGGQIAEYLEEEKSESFRFFIVNCWAWFNSFDRKMKLEESEEKIYTILDM